MTVNIGPKAIHLVVDSAGFIERAEFGTYGSKLHTTQSVLDEIRDKKTRDYVNSLPYPISIDVPTREALRWVIELSKKTGDFFALSKTDIEVIALTYQLYKETTGKEPELKQIRRPTFTDKLFPTQKPPEAMVDLDDEARENREIRDREMGERYGENGVGLALDDDDFFDPDQPDESGSESGGSSEEADPDEVIDASEWITAENFDQKLQEGLGLGGLRLDDEEDVPEEAPPVPVACLTKDFAMQNVMMNAGITLLSLNGKVIKRARTSVLWCGSCYTHTTKFTSYFCRVCGYPNLRRIPVTLHEDGQLQFHFARKFEKNLRGTKHPIIRPKGGKYADDPIYRADQRLPDRRAPKPKNPNVLPFGATNGRLLGDDDFSSDEEATADPFVLEGNTDAASKVLFPAHDVHSKAAIQGLRSDGQIVPAPWERAAIAGGSGVEHGLKPTRFRANRPGRRRTGGKRNKLTK